MQYLVKVILDIYPYPRIAKPGARYLLVSPDIDFWELEEIYTFPNFEKAAMACLLFSCEMPLWPWSWEACQATKRRRTKGIDDWTIDE